MPDNLTAQVFQNPQPGDRLTEMYAFWVIVVERGGDMVTWLEASAPCTLPEDGKAYCSTVAMFSERFRYQSDMPGWSVRATEKKSDVTGWREAIRPYAIPVCAHP